MLVFARPCWLLITRRQQTAWPHIAGEDVDLEAGLASRLLRPLHPQPLPRENAKACLH
jgi:hypothetical protein